MLPTDILTKISQQYQDLKDAAIAQRLIEEFYSGQRKLNVGKAQFSRAILALADGNISKLQEYADNLWDPRDVIMEAYQRFGHYVQEPFQS